MGVGKYSPTVSTSYMRDQKWWERNGGGYGNGKFPDKEVDDDGYDSYGYSGDFGDGPDRAGYSEMEYMVGEWDEEIIHYSYPLYERIDDEWHGKVLGRLAETG